MHDHDCPLSHPDGRLVGRPGLDRAGRRRGHAPTQPSSAAESSLALVLRAHHWTLQSAVDGAGRQVEALPPPGRPFVKNFEGARLSIHGGCNRKIGGWHLASPGTLAIGPARASLDTAVGGRLPFGEAGRCLQVRELRFDDQGLRKGQPGPWRPFVGSIEGYAHTPGVRNVLRIDRYERRPAPPDGPASICMLDLVVHSETVAGE